MPGLDAASFRFLNRCFAVDGSCVYAFTQDALIVCEEIERSTVEADGSYAVRNPNAHFHVSGSTIHRAPLPEDDA